MTPEEIAAAAALAEQKRNEEMKAVRAEAQREERERVSGIQSACRSAKLGDDFAAKMIADGTDVAKARGIVLDELAKRSEAVPTEQHVRATVTDDNRDKFIRGVSAALIERGGQSEMVSKAKAKGAKGFEKVETDPGEFRGMSPSDVARSVLERAGVSTRSIFNREDLFKRALSLRTGYAGTSDFSVLFENVMHKSMLAAYATQSDTWRRFCKTDTVSDFRSAHRFQNGSFGTLPVVAEGGEYQNKAIPDGAKKSISTETRGAVISISRQALINDDMGAMLDLAVRFGASAGRSIEQAVYDLLAQNSGLGPTCDDGIVFFNASHANIATAGALSVANLDADRLVMRAQKDVSSNDWLDLEPKILLLPVGLESAAKVINTSAHDHDGTKLQRPNPVQGMFTDIVSSPRLTASTTRRYLFTAGKEAFTVAFLEGSGEGPVMESQEGFRIDGLEWKARIDFKAQAFDPKAAVTNAGA